MANKDGVGVGVPSVMLQTQKDPKHEKKNLKGTCRFFLFDNSIQIIYIKYQYQELS